MKPAKGILLPATLPAKLNDLFLLAMMLTIAAILTTAMILQYYGGEIPCPLCLLQRVAMFGVCFGIILHFRHGYSARNDGLSMLFALFLLIVSVRQTLLDIYPRPGHSYTGSAVLGLHMPVWSVVIAVAILAAYAIKFAVLGEPLSDPEPSPGLNRIARLLSLYVIAICLINFGSVILQCGAGACHTSGYRLLSGS
jgi:disulfide bond formation protein DsbB